jgi:uncharacterized membrane protein
MATINHTVEIARPPDAVFAYIDDLARHGEWQDSIVSVHVDTDGPTRVGTRATEVRRMGSREMTITYEVTEHDPPRAFGFRGIDGPVRVLGKGTVDPVGDGSSSRLHLELDFTGHGLMGKLFAPMAHSQAAKQVPVDHARLKERLEGGL